MTDEEKKALAEMLGLLFHKGELYILKPDSARSCTSCALRELSCETNKKAACSLETNYAKWRPEP